MDDNYPQIMGMEGKAEVSLFKKELVIDLTRINEFIDMYDKE